MNKIHYIQAPVSSYANSKCDVSHEYIKKVYDYNIKPELFNLSFVDEMVIVPLGYNLLHQYIIKHRKSNPNDKIVTIGGDSSIFASTITAMNESFMKSAGDSVTSNLKIVIVDAEPNLHNFSTFNNSCLNRMGVASTLGLTDPPLATFHLLVDPSQIIYIGLRDMDDTETEILNDLGIFYFSMDKIRSLGIEMIVDSIKQFVHDDPIHLSINMKAFDPKIAPSVTKKFKDGLQFGDMEKLTKTLAPNIVSLDIVEFDAAVGTEREKHSTGELCRQILINSLGIKEKTINLYNENSEFLIFRPVRQKDPYVDIGWYIMRGIDIKVKNEIFSHKDLQNNGIVTIDLDDNDYFVAKTSINKQQEISYLMCNKVEDLALFPKEKQDMIFELING